MYLLPFYASGCPVDPFLLRYTTHIYIIVLVAEVTPVLTGISQDFTVFPYGRTSLVCTAFGIPPPLVTWAKGTTPIRNGTLVDTQVYETVITDSRSYRFAVSILEFCNIQPSHSGSYTCTLTSGNVEVTSRDVQLSQGEE